MRNALPIIIGTLCVMAIAYRYYSALITARCLRLMLPAMETLT